MPYTFTDEDKVEKEYQDRLPFGISKVQLMTVTAGATDQGKEYIEVEVTTPDGIEDKARVWFVGGAAQISFNTLKQIVVHNAKTDADKEKARQAVEACASSDDLVELMQAKTVGGELWVTKYYDPKRTYEGNDGSTKRSINTNIYGYEPKLKPELMPKDAPAGGDAVSPGSKGDVEIEDLTAGIPSDWK